MSNIPGDRAGPPGSRSGSIIIQILVFSLLLTLGGRLWYLQIRNGQEYADEAKSNHVQQVVEPAVRGSILDARGVPLADNQTRLVVSASRTDLLKMKDDGKAVLTRLAEVLGMKPTGDPQQGPALRRQDPAALLERLALPADPDHRRGHHPAGPPDPRARRGLPRHHRRAHRGPPLRRARQAPTPPRSSAISRRSPTRRSPRPRTADSPLPALRPGRPLRAGAHLRQRAARQGRRHPLRGRQPRPGHRQGQERQRPRPAPTSSPASTPGCRRVAEKELDQAMKDGPQGDRPQHHTELQGGLGRRRRHGGEDRPGRGDGLQPRPTTPTPGSAASPPRTSQRSPARSPTTRC